MIADHSQVLFLTSDLDALPYTALRDTVAARGFAIVRGLVDRDTVRARLAAMRSTFDVRNDVRHDPRDSDAVRRNLQKLQIGANSGVDSRRTLGRFMRVFYNPIFADDIYGLRYSFVKIA
jgi:hypothetical protein